MNLNTVKKAVGNFLLLTELTVLFFLLIAAVQGTLGLLSALGYGAGSFVAVNFLLRLLLLPSGKRRAHRCTRRVTPAFWSVTPRHRHAA